LGRKDELFLLIQVHGLVRDAGGSSRVVAVMRLSVEESVARARILSGGGHRAILGITGQPGAGKSTVARSLVSQVPGSVLLGMDAFHLAHSSLERLRKVERKGAPDTFDPAGYVALLTRIRRGEAGVIWAPEFRREIEDSVAGAVAIPPEATLIVTEGNYLLLDEGPWATLRELLDEIWYVEVPESVRRDRLTRRHEEFGRSPAQARARTLGSDEDNARMVLKTRDRADALVVHG
jgi:pantothenate kinase